MIVFYALLFVVILSRLRYSWKGYYYDYLSFDTTNSIKGVFIFLVFLKHIVPYIIHSGYVFNDCPLNRIFLFLNAHVGQWIVAMFLFYSGYGIMESIQKKGIRYIASIPRKRILTTLINFDIAVTLFGAIALSFRKTYLLKEYVLAYLGWESVGNSNWYIFVIILCYCIAWISFRNSKLNYKHYIIGASVCFLLLVALVILLSYLRPSWWYNTILCFGAGMLYSVFHEAIEPVVRQRYWLLVSVVLLLFIVLGQSPYYCKGLMYNAYCIAFCFLIVFLSMKISINNPILIWAGKNLFPLYIYQRVPMIVLSYINGGAFVSSFPILYTAVCLLVTLLLAYFYKYWAVKL